MKFISFSLIFLFIHTSKCYQCKDHNDNPVDWFIAYKLPLTDKNENNLISTGAAYTFMTSNDYKDGWKLSQISINDTNSLIALTLKPLYQSKIEDDVYVLYNDELPDSSVNFRKGHTKGVVISNEEGGLWFIHSVPRFPSTKTKNYFYPHNGYEYGQSFLCVSFDLNNINIIGKQLQYNEPSVYQSNIPESLKTILPNIVNVINEVPINTAPSFSFAKLVSKNGTSFVSFAKGKHFNKDLYEDWIGPFLNSSLYVETWLNGPGRLPSDCSRVFHVENIESVKIRVANLTFKSSVDHSKWAVTPPDNLWFWTCIGDINRMKGQEKRGGGTVCISNKKVATTFQKSIEALENCN